MGLDDLPVVVADHIGAVAMQHARTAGGDRGGMPAGLDAVARRFDADDRHFGIVEERMEQADRVAAAADAGDDRIRQPAIVGQHLRARLASDHGVEIAHHARIRIRAGDSADDVESVLHVGHPVAHRFVQRILQRLRTGGDRHHGRAEQLHAVDVDLLALDVGRAHVHHAFQAQPRGDGGAGHAVLAGAGLGDDAGLAHAAGQQGLADGVVDLVRAGVVQILALEQDARAADFPRQALGFVDGAGPADVMLEVFFELGDEGRVHARRVIGGCQFLQRADQGFGDEAPAIASEVATGVRIGVVVGGPGLVHGLGRTRSVRDLHFSAHKIRYKAIKSQ